MIRKNPLIKGWPNAYRATLVALMLLPAGCGDQDQPAGKAPSARAPAPQPGPPPQTPSAVAPAPAAQPASPVSAAPPSPPAPAAKPLSDMQSLVAPIALYPDPLLAELLVASTYPLEVVQAVRWLDGQPDLSTLKGKDWDASIQRLVDVPQVLRMMNDHLDWTTRLGDTFLAQPDALMGAIQALRLRANQSGFLKDTPEQKVSIKTEPVREVQEPEAGDVAAMVQPAVVKKEVVYIEPAKSDTVYVPQYSPEQAYSAPLAPAPGATPAAYPATAATYPSTTPGSYYPGYYPPATSTTTATTSTTDSLLTFGAGALVGGLLTWGIMEWADNDDYWHGYYGGGYYPPVSHYYGGAVCRNGNCWTNGGNWDRGNVYYNKNVNFSGNEIDIDRGRNFNQGDLASWRQDRQGWTPEVRHRRGQQFPAAARERLGQIQQPGLAGDRLGAAQTLPANVRGFGERGQAPNRPSTLPAERRPSSAEVRQRLSQNARPGEQIGRKRDANRPGARPSQNPANRPNALEGLGENGRQARIENRRGESSRSQSQAGQMGRERRQSNGSGQASQRRAQAKPAGETQRRDAGGKLGQQRRAVQPQSADRSRRAGGGPRDYGQIRDNQRRVEAARPNAFESARNPSRTLDYSQRGAASRQSKTVNRPTGGGARFQGGGGGGGARFQGGGGRRFQGGGGPRGGGGGRRGGRR